MGRQTALRAAHPEAHANAIATPHRNKNLTARSRIPLLKAFAYNVRWDCATTASNMRVPMSTT
eukprot:CAMPEP_0117538408 /NCGR_PEP_ID=MMETSP0784-20121206/42464_1 /TAXON_ID=39447 /ORGANISM="" /LENGTH=62 /DNA_ID=CAMNT_0005335023 /DNA_START=134 /DNA_END=318 /DNA_ORIENTATION=+